jgi:hypothetical protein
MLRKNLNDSSFAKPLIVWIVIQLIAIILSAIHIRLWATAPRATETLALDELLFAQFLISSLLFPFLCRTWQSTTAMILTSLPMIAFAATLAGIGDSICIACWLNLSIWLLGLLCFRRLLPTPAAELIAVATLSTLNISAILICYLTAEMTSTELHGEFIPLPAAIIMIHAPHWPTFLPAAILLLLTAISLAISRAKLSTILSTKNH